VLKWKQLKANWNISSKHPILICYDNLAAVNFAGNTKRYKFITSKIPDSDIIQGVREALQTEHFDFRHVKGHQDKFTRTLDFYAVLNIHADKQANEAGQSQTITNEPYKLVDGSVWELFIRDRKVHKTLQQVLLDWIHKKSIEKYWIKKTR
jgi:hypothetical protein